MPQYLVTIIETLALDITVDADSKEDAVSKVKKDYDEEVYILTGDNWVDTDIEVDEL